MDRRLGARDLAMSAGKTALVLLAGAGAAPPAGALAPQGQPSASPTWRRFTDLIGGIGLVGAGLLVVLNR